MDSELLLNLKRQAVRSDDEIELDRCALLINQAFCPDLDIDHYLHRLDAMAEHLQYRLQGVVRNMDRTLKEIHRYLYKEEGFLGNVDSYYDPRNSLLSDVLDRKLGIPVTLSLIYLEVTRRLGLKFQGIGLPGHFLIRYDDGMCNYLIDPFNRGAFLTDEGCKKRLASLYGAKVGFDNRYLEPIPRRKALIRLLNNLKAIYLHANDPVSAIKTIDLLLCIDPDNVAEYKVRGLLFMKLECFTGALGDLEQYVMMRPDDAASIHSYLSTARDFCSRIH